MINPSIVELLKYVDNKYSLVIATSKRARKLIDGESPIVDMDASKPLTTAIVEVNSSKMNIDSEGEELSTEDKLLEDIFIED
ncbi:DNA-directed RNA polymerase subunit omega [Oceanirhabdus sp. W0125-5]|uniref:DNA-directed RNA polymerase subunit omega n=1 Tax=Oceanirhabdus sp. W0125-5 TaxID=2999116 RepID=UPI003FA53D2F